MGSLRSGWSRRGIYRRADGRESKSRQAEEQVQIGRRVRAVRQGS